MKIHIRMQKRYIKILNACQAALYVATRCDDDVGVVAF